MAPSNDYVTQAKRPRASRVRTLLMWVTLMLGPVVLSGATAVRADCCGIPQPPIRDLTSLGHRLVFVADDGEHGQELWRSDGTPSGTRLTRDIRPGKRGAGPHGFLTVAGVSGETVLLWAKDGEHGQELWRSDGTRRGTRLIEDVWPGRRAAGWHSVALTVGDDTFYFATDHPRHGASLWRTDGTAKNTKVVMDLESVPDDIVVGDGVYFTTRRLRELWHSDGSAAGTSLLATASKGSQFQYLTPIGDMLYFTDAWGREGQQLWRSDSTAEGTTLVNTIGPPFDTGDAPSVLPVGDSVYVDTNYEDHETGKMVSRLWRSDGTPDGTTRAIELPPCWECVDVEIAAIGDTHYIRHRGRLWRFEGATEGTLLADPRAGGTGMRVFDLLAAGDTLYFTAKDGRGLRLWRADATNNAPTIVNVGPSDPAKTIAGSAVVGEAVYWWAYGSGTDTELWRTDGTTEGTRLVKDIPPGQHSPLLADFTAVGNLVFFTHDNGHELWRSDGTLDGTVLLLSVP